MTGAALTVWVVTLVVVVVVIVPVALSLLGRTLTAARAIEGYLKDMLEAGVKIADHTGAVPQLDNTLAAAAAMAPVVASIQAKTGAVAELLSGRAKEG